MKEVTAYRCKHCGKLYLKKKVCKEHDENRCTQNPQIRPLCYSCQHYNPSYLEEDKEEIVFYLLSPFGEQRDTKMFDPHRCDHPEINSKLFNNVKLSEAIYNALVEDYDYRPMPVVSKGGCGHYKPVPGHPYAKDNQSGQSA